MTEGTKAGSGRTRSGNGRNGTVHAMTLPIDNDTSPIDGGDSEAGESPMWAVYRGHLWETKTYSAEQKKQRLEAWPGDRRPPFQHKIMGLARQAVPMLLC